MSDKDSRSGGKYSGNHRTLIPVATTLSDIAQKCPHVTKICPGYISAGKKSTSGVRRVKIHDDGKSILLSISSNVCHQEVRIYTKNVPATRLLVAKGALNKGIKIRFKN